MAGAERRQAESERNKKQAVARDVEGEALAAIVARAVDGLKAEDVLVLDVRGLTDVMDFMVLASAGSTRQLRALHGAAEDAVRGADRHAIGEEGDAGTGWTVVDTGDVVCHLMTRDLRAYYDLEGLWGDARAVDLGGPVGRPKGDARQEDGAVGRFDRIGSDRAPGRSEEAES